MPSNPRAAGSGTAALVLPVNENAALNGPCVGDVGADALPIRRQRTGAIVAYPALQVSRERCAWRNDRLRSREPEEVAGISQIDLGAEEDVIRTER